MRLKICLILLILITAWNVTACAYSDLLEETKNTINPIYLKDVTTIELTDIPIIDSTSIERCSVYYPKNKSIYIKKAYLGACSSYRDNLIHEVKHHWCCKTNASYCEIKNEYEYHQGCFLTTPIK